MYCLYVNVYCTAAPGGNPIVFSKYIYINNVEKETNIVLLHLHGVIISITNMIGIF